MVVVKKRLLGPSSNGSLDMTNTGFYVALSVIVTSYASQAIFRYGAKGVAGAYRVGVLSFCVGSWVGIYTAGIPLSNGRRILPEVP